MIKTYKVKLKPNNKQQTKMFQFCGAKRFAYNWAIAKEKENYFNGGKFMSDSILRKEFTQLKKTEEYKWLYSISNNVTKQAIKGFLKDILNFLSLKVKRNQDLVFM